MGVDVQPGAAFEDVAAESAIEQVGAATAEEAVARDIAGDRIRCAAAELESGHARQQDFGVELTRDDLDRIGRWMIGEFRSLGKQGGVHHRDIVEIRPRCPAVEREPVAPQTRRDLPQARAGVPERQLSRRVVQRLMVDTEHGERALFHDGEAVGEAFVVVLQSLGADGVGREADQVHQPDRLGAIGDELIAARLDGSKVVEELVALAQIAEAAGAVERRHRLQLHPERGAKMLGHSFERVGVGARRQQRDARSGQVRGR